MHLNRSTTALAAVTLVLLTACGDDGAAEPEELSVQVGDGTITGLPAKLEAGIYQISIRNDGTEMTSVDLIEADGVTDEQVTADMAALIEGGPFPGYIEHVVGLAPAPPAGEITTTLTLTPGVYKAVDTSGEAPVVVGEVEVTGDPPDVSDLPDGPTIVAKDYQFEVSGIEAGAQQVTFVNEGPEQVHHAVIVGFPEGTDEATAREAIGTLLTLEEGQAPPAGTPEPDFEVGGSAVFSSDAGGTFDVTFEAGRVYGIMCFISDRAGGAPHAIAHDMYDVFTVEG